MTGNRLNLADQISYPRVSINDISTTISPRFSVAAVRTLTAPRALTLPAANAYPPDLPLHIVDESGLVTPTNTITISATGNDTINGLASIVSKTPYFSYAFHSDGVSKWTIRYFGLATLGNDPNFSISGNSALTQALADSLYVRRRNHFWDSGFRFSQEQGNNVLTLSNNASLYPSDSLLANRSGSVGGATIQRVLSPTPGGSLYRNRLIVTSTNPSPAAGDYLLVQTRLEGQDITDLRFGSAAARTIMIRFGCNCSVAGTYTLGIRNGALSRGYVGTYQIASNEVNMDVVKTVVLVADQSGSWTTDRSFGLSVSWLLNGGSNTQTTANTWSNSNGTTIAGSTNLMSVANATFELFDIALYDVTGLTPGVVPAFELPDIDIDYQKCLNYVCADNIIIAPFYVQVNTNMAWPFFFPKPMRVTPTLIVVNNTSPSAGGVSVVPRSNYSGSSQIYSQYGASDNGLSFSYVAFARIQ